MQHTEPTMSDRGFAGMPPIPTTEGAHEGGEISAYESSSAEEAAIWVKVQRGEAVQSFAHIGAENAWRLSDQLRTLVRNHYYGDMTPDWARAALIERLAADRTLQGISGDAGCTETDLAEAVADVILGGR